MSFKDIPEHEAVLIATDPVILVTSRPGRGKTTLSLRIAARYLSGNSLAPWQEVLFLSFSRNAVYQIEQASQKLEIGLRGRIRIATYHSFAWWLIEGFGRFNGMMPNLRVMGQTEAKTCRHVAKISGRRKRWKKKVSGTISNPLALISRRGIG